MNRSWFSILGGIMALTLATPVLAHNIEVAGDIAGTWHVEPNHSPKAGEPAQVWVALTRQGGAILPLEAANCQLGVYQIPRQQGDEPILRPALKPIAVEQYQGIPAAEITFPDTGLYEVELGCLPRTEADFQPFQMTYQITVAEAATPSSTTSPAPTDEPIPQTADPLVSPTLLLALAGIVGLVTIVTLRRLKK